MKQTHRMNHHWNSITLCDGWGDLTDEQIDLLTGEVVGRFESETGFTWVPQTSEIIADADAEVDVDELNEKRLEIVEAIFNDQDNLLAAAKL